MSKLKLKKTNVMRNFYNDHIKNVSKGVWGLVVLTLISITAIGLTVAYFTSRPEVKVNTFSVGNVEIKVEEPNFKPDDNTNVEPKDVINKDPKVKNTGENAAYVFLKVEVPKKDVVIVNDDETMKASAVTELFSYNINSNWELISTDTTETDYNTYVYAYTTGPLAKGSSTNSLFDTITYANVLEGEVKEKLLIPITGYAIQSDSLELTGSSLKDKLTYAYDTYLKEM